MTDENCSLVYIVEPLPLSRIDDVEESKKRKIIMGKFEVERSRGTIIITVRFTSTKLEYRNKSFGEMVADKSGE